MRIALLLCLLLVAVPVSAQPAPTPQEWQTINTLIAKSERPSPWLQGTLAATTILQAADLAQTMHCLGAGTCKEVNPILKGLSTQPVAFATAKFSLALVSHYALLNLSKEHPKRALIFSVINVGVLAFVVRHNALQLR